MEYKDETLQTDYDLVPPDGGWGWLVLFGCTLINFLLPGTIKSFGVLFVEFLEKFEFSEVAASWIPAVCYFLYCSLGPLSNYLSSKFSYRTVALIGGTFASLGLILSYFATSVVYLCFTYGLLFGTGTGLSFPPGIFIVTSYFQKYRGLANGIAVSGSAFGSMILPPLLRYLLKNYGVNGAVLIMGAISMNVWVGALFYHPVAWHMKRVPISSDQGAAPQNTVDGCNIHSETELEEHEMNTPRQAESKEIVLNGDITHKPSEVGGPKSSIDTVLCYSSSTKKVSIVRPASPRRDECESPLRRNSSYVSVSSSTKGNSTSYADSTLSRLQPLEYASQITLKSITESLTAKRGNGDQKSSSELAELLSNPVFITILISSATTAIGYTNFTIFLPVYATSLHYDKTSSSCLLSVVALFDLVGRLGGSTISDILPFSKKYYFITGLTISGISLVILPLARSYFALCVACAIFGLASGTFSGVFVVTIVELLGEDKLASSYTATLFINGILHLVGPPICGLIYKNMRSFGTIISALGVTVALGGGVWILPVCSSVQRWR